MYFLFNSDIVNLLINTNGGGALVGLGELEAWSGKSCLGPAENHIFCVPGFIKGWGDAG